MNLSPRWVDTFMTAGFQATHWSAIGAANASDGEIMAVARAQGFVVVTHDLDFSAILAATQDAKPSVVQIRGPGDLSPEAIGATVIDVLLRTRQNLIDGALVTIDLHRTRVRVLPLQTRPR